MQSSGSQCLQSPHPRLRGLHQDLAQLGEVRRRQLPDAALGAHEHRGAGARDHRGEGLGTRQGHRRERGEGGALFQCIDEHVVGIVAFGHLIAHDLPRPALRLHALAPSPDLQHRPPPEPVGRVVLRRRISPQLHRAASDDEYARFGQETFVQQLLTGLKGLLPEEASRVSLQLSTCDLIGPSLSTRQVLIQKFKPFNAGLHNLAVVVAIDHHKLAVLAADHRGRSPGLVLQGALSDDNSRAQDDDQLPKVRVFRPSADSLQCLVAHGAILGLAVRLPRGLRASIYSP
mmetsp:Transcript_143363/g.458212  ORF Transcript_143363/g.458212 Transcript_143363/m.458212 type:complete len:288 (+) Transcript_143363:213-1076(+)